MKQGLMIRFFSISLLVMTFYIASSLKEKKDVRVSNTSNWAELELKQLSLEEKIGQFFMLAAYSNQGESHLLEIENYIKNQKIGGVIFFQGERDNLKIAINRFQKASKVPLLIGMDAEWGVQMRLFGKERFPYAYTIGAANNLPLSERIGSIMAQECRELGIHMNFSPVADVNANPDNPVIGFRSFGENPKHVAEHVRAMVKGMESMGVLTSIKHFPGHGDTDKDSHLELPQISKSFKTLDAVDFYPFREGIAAGASTVMVGHLNVPALDSSGTPSSLSKVTIQKYLKEYLGFKGLVISDALNMKAITNKYGKTEAVVKAFEAGCDILLFPESVDDAIKAIAKKVRSGAIKLEDIDERCLKILKKKQALTQDNKTFKKYSSGEIDWAKKEVYEGALTVLKNKDSIFPIKDLSKKIAVVSIGSHTSHFVQGLKRFGRVDHFHAYTGEEAVQRYSKLKGYDLIITSIHANSVRPRNDFGMPSGWRMWMQSIPESKKQMAIFFCNPLVLKEDSVLKNVDGVVIAYENYFLAQERMSQFVMGAMPAQGKLSMTISSRFFRNFGIHVPWAGRLKYSQIEELGIDSTYIKRIDSVVENAIEKEAFPGCQIVAAVDGKMFLRKAYGRKKYEDTTSVYLDDVYDIASVTKIAASTLGIMRLESQGTFSIHKRLKDYLPALTKDNDFGSIQLRDMLTHQAGLPAWIPFYTKTLENGKLKEELYSKVKKKGYETQVAKDLWILDSYVDTIYQRILSSKLGSKKYEYSDLGYYFLKKIIEQKKGVGMEEFLLNEVYNPMGLSKMRYRPLNYFPIEKIIPTEEDLVFRKQLVHGYVHDPGAAMLGGVGGHAGLFSNATDLACIMQLFLNGGNYGGNQLIQQKVVDDYTRCQFCPSNRRALGFDKPKTEGGGTCCSLASQASFGHSGFTGTLAWADPDKQINFVFLSNRVYKNADNWKIVKMNVRTDIQRLIYEAIASRK
jgi:beta-N-acetylhexosaminidase